MPDKASSPPPSCKQNSLLALVAVLGAAASLAHGLQTPINDDDVYHLHSIWLTAQGVLPYTEFFEIHFPGLWVVASFLIGIWKSASAILLAGRVSTALLFGGCIYLGGRIIQARAGETLWLGSLGLLLLLRSEFFIFRAEFVAAFLVMLHWWILTRDLPASRLWISEFWAAASLALACTMSVRPIGFLIVQPLMLACSRQGDYLGRRAIGYLLGLAAGVTPAAALLSRHHLWADAIQWTFRFTSSGDIVSWKTAAFSKYAAILIPGVVCAWALNTEQRLPIRTRQVLFIAGIAAFAFYAANPLRMPFSNIHFFLVGAVIATAGVCAGLRLVQSRLDIGRQRFFRIIATGSLALIAAVAVARNAIHMASDRNLQSAQLRLLDWLQNTAKREHVVLIAPNHPVAVRDASDLQNAWQYGYWIQDGRVRNRLSGLAETLLRLRPAAIAKNPWPALTGGRDLVDWLAFHNVLDVRDVHRLREMLHVHYVEVTFPAIAALPYGHVFWIRRDLFVPPDRAIPYVVTTPAPPEGRSTNPRSD